MVDYRVCVLVTHEIFPFVSILFVNKPVFFTNDHKGPIIICTFKYSVLSSSRMCRFSVCNKAVNANLPGFALLVFHG